MRLNKRLRIKENIDNLEKEILLYEISGICVEIKNELIKHKKRLENMLYGK